MRYFFIEPSAIVNGQAILTGSDARHIKTVLRLKPGDSIGLFDGQGLEHRAYIMEASPGRIRVAIEQTIPVNTESPVRIAVAQALLQDKKMDILVRQLTELGVAKWAPFLAERSVPKPDGKRMGVRKERWERIAREAVKQCRRGRAPEIHAVKSFEDLMESLAPGDLKIAFWEQAAEPLKPERLTKMDGFPPDRPRNILVLVGPEGGLTAAEMDRARSFGFMAFSLGPRILRAETAALAGCTLVQYFWGDMGPGMGALNRNAKKS